MDPLICGTLVVLAGLAGVPMEDARVEPRDSAVETLAATVETTAAHSPTPAPRSAEPAAVSFRFLTREEGHELLLSDVHLTIRHPVEGTLVDTVSNGPYLVAFIPAGRYEVAATHEGRERRMNLTIPRAEPRSVALYW
jgi:hypothetical protein